MSRKLVHPNTQNRRVMLQEPDFLTQIADLSS